MRRKPSQLSLGVPGAAVVGLTLACAGAGTDAPRECERYIACAAAVAPSELGTIEATYGDDGTCWDGDEELAATCVTACENGTEILLGAAPGEEACGGDPEAAACADTAGNQAPVADAGSPVTAALGDEVRLDGSGSSDGDGDELTFHWTLDLVPDGSDANAVLATFSANHAPDAAAPTFVPDLRGTYVVELTVDDCAVDSSEDFVIVTVD